MAATATVTEITAADALTAVLAKTKTTGEAETAARAAVTANVRLAATKGEIDNVLGGFDSQYCETVTFIAGMLSAGVSTRNAAAIMQANPGLLDIKAASVGNYATVQGFIALTGTTPEGYVVRPSDLNLAQGEKSVYSLILKALMPGDWKDAVDAAGIKYGKAVVAGIYTASADKAEAVQALEDLYSAMQKAHKDAVAAAKAPKAAEVYLKSATEGVVAKAVESAATGNLGDVTKVAEHLAALEAQIIVLRAAVAAAPAPAPATV